MNNKIRITYGDLESQFCEPYLQKTAYQWEYVFEDALAAVNKLSEVKERYPIINMEHVYVVGHSADGLRSYGVYQSFYRCISNG